MTRGIGWTLAVALLAAACGRPDAPRTATDDEPDTPAASLVAVRGVAVGSRVDANGVVEEPRETFLPGEPIVLSAETEGDVDEVVLVARWTRANGEVIEESQAVFPVSGRHVATFRLSEPPGPGDYRVVLFLGSDRVAAREFRVADGDTAPPGG